MRPNGLHVTFEQASLWRQHCSIEEIQTNIKEADAKGFAECITNTGAQQAILLGLFFGISWHQQVI